MYLKYIPQPIRTGLSSATWSIPPDDTVYLTFDDGPTEETGNILKVLAEYDAKATFFLLGEQIEKHPDLLLKIKGEGHGLGNHGYKHLDGWKTSHEAYLSNMHKGKELCSSSDYRPPYGRMSPKQWKSIAKTERICMWSMMPGDFDPKMTVETCYDMIQDKAEPGSIIVLHDNQKSSQLLMVLLPRILNLFKEKGLQMKPLPSR